jgi:hypothetical protein
VPPFFFVEGADDFRPNRGFRSRRHRRRRQLHGARREVRIEDVIAELGPRVPDHTRGAAILRQAYVLVADGASAATSRRRVRSPASARASRSEYRRATGGRATVDTTLP